MRIRIQIFKKLIKSVPNDDNCNWIIKKHLENGFYYSRVDITII